MPQKNGWYFIENFVHPENTIIFILSSSVSEADKAKTYPSIAAYLEKPLTIEQLDFMKANF